MVTSTEPAAGPGPERCRCGRAGAGPAARGPAAGSAPPPGGTGDQLRGSPAQEPSQLLGGLIVLTVEAVVPTLCQMPA